MKLNSLITPTMQYLKFILVLSALVILGALRLTACGPYYPDRPEHIKMFRACTPELEQQWRDGCRFQDYEKDQNCLLWQKISSEAIPLDDIKEMIYSSRLSDFDNLPGGNFAANKFAQWLSRPENIEDLQYIRIAKEIEEIREYMNNPWYYGYCGDDEHSRLDGLLEKCESYTGKRHAARYALQTIRLYFAKGDFGSCLKLWEDSLSRMPRDIVTDMIASYVGGAYSRCGNRDKAIELFTLSGDIGSLISMKAWNDAEEKTEYTDRRVRQLEYIFNRFPDSPLLSIRLQEYVRKREDYVYVYEDWEDRGLSLGHDDERRFYDELKRFARKAIASAGCHRKGMWHYGLAYLYYLDGNIGLASAHLNQAERSETTPFIKESVRAFRLLVDAIHADNSSACINALKGDLQCLDEHMVDDFNLSPEQNWHYKNKMNWPTSYWQDVARKVLLGVLCPKLMSAGNSTLALQLANYASNRVYQLSPMFETYHYGSDDPDDNESYTVVIPFDEYRKKWPSLNYFDYSNQFFGMIYSCGADDAACYAQRITHPKSELDKFLNERSYLDTDYIYDIVGTLYMRETNYKEASAWLAKVSEDYQSRTNIAKEGYFRLDPFRYQVDKEHLISDSGDYKLRFAQEMERLAGMIQSDTEPNRKAEAKIRYALGLRNSFGKCWYLTDYRHSFVYESSDDGRRWNRYTSADRESFKYNSFAQEAYRQVDRLMQEALAEFTDSEKAAQAQLEMMNFSSVIEKYPGTKAAEYVRSRCDSYHDYSLQKR